jgi:hypothetical protein
MSFHANGTDNVLQYSPNGITFSGTLLNNVTVSRSGKVHSSGSQRRLLQSSVDILAAAAAAAVWQQVQQNWRELKGLNACDWVDIATAWCAEWAIYAMPPPVFLPLAVACVAVLT